MADHGARDHATWSASATARNVFCSGALALERIAPPDKESIHSARGTACHQVAEKCLRTGKDPADFIGEIEKTKAHEIEIDEELAGSAEMYVDYCRERMAGAYWIEEKLSFGKLDPPFDAGGTGDFVAYDHDYKRLEIVDLKNGMGIVDINDNPQLRSYGLGAVLKHPELDVETIKVTIVQPRAPHKDGRIRSETFHIADLLDWTTDLLASMQRSKKAIDEFDACAGNSVLLDEWAEKWLKPGKCTFCRVEGSCPALKKKALEKLAIWVDDKDVPHIGNAALDTSPEALAHDLDLIPMIEDWIKARRAFAHSQAELGVAIPNYVLVDKEGREKWNDGVEDAVVAAAKAAGLKDEKYQNKPKLRTPKQVRQALGAKSSVVAGMSNTPKTGTNLVRKDNTVRDAVTPGINKFLD